MPIRRNRTLVPDRVLDALLKRFEEGTSTDGGTTLRYELVDFRELYEILPDAFVVRPAVSRSEAVGLFAQALRHCRAAGPLTGEALLERAAAIHHSARAVPLQPYTLWTKFRARGMAHAPGFRMEWSGVRLRTAATLPGWLQLDEFVLNGTGRIRPNDPPFFGYVVLSCEDRDENRAVDRILDALQLAHGLLNMYESFGRISFSGGRDWTEGGLWLGPNQFLFRGRRFLGEEQLWYNPDYTVEAWKRAPLDMNRILSVVPMARRALGGLEDHPLRSVLVRSLQLFQDGLAARDGNQRLLRYWAALEQLYIESDAKDRSNQKVIERALFAEGEPETARWKLEHVARLRNEYVHAGGTGDDLQALGQFLRGLLERHLNYWIFRGRDLPDHSAMLAFLKLPGERSRLSMLRDLVDRRLALMEVATRRSVQVE